MQVCKTQHFGAAHVVSSLIQKRRILDESKLSVPDRNIEPAAASIDVKPDVSIHKEVELKDGFAELAKKGIRIKDYREDIPKKRSWKVGSGS